MSDTAICPAYLGGDLAGLGVNADTTLLRLMNELTWGEFTDARKEYFMAATPMQYTYGVGKFARTYDSSEYHSVVSDIQNALNSTGLSYNVCFLNRYDGRGNFLGWHADDSPGMSHEHPIAVVSYGAEREIWWKPQSQKGEIPADQRQLLGHGSLFVMPAGFQKTHFHRIPKGDRDVGTRISLTFRRYEP